MKKINPSLIILSFLVLGCSSQNSGVVKIVEENNEISFSVYEESPNYSPTPVCQHNRVVHINELHPTFEKPGHIEFYYCLDCQKSYRDYYCKTEVPNSNYLISDKRDGRYVSPLTKSITILSKNIRDYLDAETEKDIINALKNNRPINDQVSYTINWNSSYKGPFTVEFSNKRDDTTRELINPTLYNNIKKNYFSFDPSLIPGHIYYYNVKDATGEYIINDFSFSPTTKYSVRTMAVEGVNNVRDLGGWKTTDGKTVKYGMLYRGGSLSNITEKGKDTYIETMGIKTEIDLRYDEWELNHEHYGGVQELFDPRLREGYYQNCGMWCYNEIIPGTEIRKTYHSTSQDADIEEVHSFDSYSIPNIKKAFELLANKDNYPIYFHCVSGADRTGTLAYLINGLLGVSYEDLIKDFELTSFSNEGITRYRNEIAEDGISFEPGSFAVHPFSAFDKMNELFFEGYGDDNGSPLPVIIERYLTDFCGINPETLTSIKSILLEE